MAIDTRNKRASCLGLGLDFLRVRPTPDGTLDASDRAALGWQYAGIAASALAAAAGGVWPAAARSTVLVARDRATVWESPARATVWPGRER